MVFLNGVLFKDLTYLSTLGSKDISRIEINNEYLLCGDMTFPGFICIYTYDGQLPEYYQESNTFTYVNEVLPDDNNELKAGAFNNTGSGPGLPDFRQTLFWDANVKLSGSDKVTFEFQTSQLKGLYGVNIQGITNGGRTLNTNFHFEVE